jgi:hypothetical protein
VGQKGFNLYFRGAAELVGHHLILGELTDLITGKQLKDTHDERYRQKIAYLLMNQKGYSKPEIEPRRKLLVQAGNKKAVVKIDFLITISNRVRMLVRYGPGSLVTRRRPVLAASRLVVPYQIPIAVVTNGEDAEILEGISGKVLCQGLEGIPSRQALNKLAANDPFIPISKQRAEIESRILYCYEVEGSCPCDEDVERL